MADFPEDPISPEKLLSPDGVSTLDDMAVGQRYDFGIVEITSEDIIDFARRFDPQLFHLDEAAATNSMFGGLIASGLHTLSATHGATVRCGFMQRAGKAGIGFDEVRFHRPVYAGDRLHVTGEVISIGPSRRREHGPARLRYRSTNQKGETVLTAVIEGLFHRRPPAN